MMSKRDYIKFADMIADAQNEVVYRHTNETYKQDYIDGMQTQLDNLRFDMIQLFQSDNPNFDAKRFNDYIDKRVNELSHR